MSGHRLETHRIVAALVAVVCCFFCVSPTACYAADGLEDRIRSTVDDAIRPVMAKDDIPGMAVGVTIGGRHWVFNYGVASRATGKPVGGETLFEVGSISKTFTATLASWAQVDSRLSLSDGVGKYLPTLRDTQFGKVTLVNLGTHTSGGLPLQVPDSVRNDDQLMRYLKEWRPAHTPGTYRTYSNISIGMLGLITAKSMGQDFTVLMERRLFPALGLSSTFIHVPEARMTDYAQGYNKDGKPVRMSNGVLSAESYGIKSTATDLIHFAEVNMSLVNIDGNLQRAITETHTGYFQAGVMTQDLIWEEYPYPVALKTLLEGNSATMIFEANPVTAIQPSQAARQNVWINKTGSTKGFGAYVAFVPEKNLGVIVLANRNYPTEERVAVGYKIITSLANLGQ